MIRHVMLVLICMFALMVVSSAENLGDLSKKEKARRDAIAKKGKKPKVFTNADIENLKAQLALQESSGTPEENTTTEPSETTEPQPTEVPEQMEEIPAPEPVVEEPQQNDSSKPSKEEQIKALKEQKEQLEQEAENARKTIGAGGYYHSRDVGGQSEKISEAEEKLEDVNKKIEELESQPDQP